jgi:hypothetical protein
MLHRIAHRRTLRIEDRFLRLDHYVNFHDHRLAKIETATSAQPGPAQRSAFTGLSALLRKVTAPSRTIMR